MTKLGKTGERLVALFLFGVLAFNPPLLSIFDRDSNFVGVPLLYFYLFGAWAALVALMALTIERGPGKDEVNTDNTTPHDRRDPPQRPRMMG
jgi:hypothetical protein